MSLRFAPSPMRPGLSLGYLLCRAADTLADTDAVPASEREQMLMRFRELLTRFPLSKNTLQDFVMELEQYGAFLKGSEGQLLQQLPIIVESFLRCSKTEQAIIMDVVSAVCQGMGMDLKKFGDSIETVRAFESKTELETYLCLIGGEPGHFWSKLCLTAYPHLRIKNRSEWIEDGIRFGTGLQMINILRDFPADLARGRCYLPSDILKDHGLSISDVAENKDPERFRTLYYDMINDTLDRIEYGMTYLLAIPKNYPRLRAPVWWPLAIGLKTLAKIRKTNNVLDTGTRVKIKRTEVFRTIGTSIGLMTSNALLERSFRKLKEAAS